MRPFPTTLLLTGLIAGSTLACGESAPEPEAEAAVNDELRRILAARAFTGRIEETLEARLGRPVRADLADLGRLLFFDPVLSLTRDNSCSGCHGPNVSFNDSQAISIGVGNNGVVGPGRAGPFNQRRAPTLMNAAFYPRLMWDSRFASNANDPFDNRAGYSFPEPEGASLSDLEHLLVAQAYTPVVNRVEMAGAFEGDNDAMRAEVARRVEEIPEYMELFSLALPALAEGAGLTYEHIASALAEFMFTLVRADAPIDAFARGDVGALTHEQKLGAVQFFRLDGCGECHIVRGYANEMFSDFEAHVLAVPQLKPSLSNMTFDGPGADEDYGVEQQTGRLDDRYEFRTSPLRNVVFQPSYMHNGAYVCLEGAIRHHLEVFDRLDRYQPSGLTVGLRATLGPSAPMLNSLLDLVSQPMQMTDAEFDQLLDFVRVGLTDPDAAPEALRHLIPARVPSGLPVHQFDFEAPLGGSC